MKRRYAAVEADSIARVAAMSWRDFYEVTVLYFGWPEQKAREVWDFAQSSIKP